MITSQPKYKIARVVSSQKLVINCFLYQAMIPLLKFKSGSNFLIKMKNTKSTEQENIRESKWQFSLSGKLVTKYAHPSLTEIFYPMYWSRYFAGRLDTFLQGQLCTLEGNKCLVFTVGFRKCSKNWIGMG